MLERHPRVRSALNFLAIVVTIGVATTCAIKAVKVPPPVLDYAGTAPLGYTKSLALFVFPLISLAWWFLRHPECERQKKAFWRSIFWLAPTGFGLDLLFANTFFEFPNHEATLRACVDPTGSPLSWDHASLFCVPARGGVVPVEEFVFYLTGFMVVLLSYIWADEYWLERYNDVSYRTEAARQPRLLQFHPAALGLGTGLVALVFLARELLAEAPTNGWPGYSVFLIAVSVVPTVGLFHTVRKTINWRAFAFTFFLIVMVSLIWEVTLALPYGWWGYREAYMIGLFVDVWHRLPIEAVLVWLAVTFTTVVVFEAVKVGLAKKEGAGAPSCGAAVQPSGAPRRRGAFGSSGQHASDSLGRRQQ